MTDEDGDIGIIDILVHDDVVAVAGIAQIDEMLVILAVVAGDLTGVIELIKQLIAKDGLHLRHAGARVQTVGEQQQDIPSSPRRRNTARQCRRGWRSCGGWSAGCRP